MAYIMDEERAGKGIWLQVSTYMRQIMYTPICCLTITYLRMLPPPPPFLKNPRTLRCFAPSITADIPPYDFYLGFMIVVVICVCYQLCLVLGVYEKHCARV